MLGSKELGYNEKEKRFGLLFSNTLVSSYMHGTQTDENLF